MKFLLGKGGALLLLAVAIVFPLISDNPYHIYLMSLAFIWAIATAGMNLITGYTGQLNLAHAGFMAIGAYTVGILTVDYGLNFWAAFAVSGLLAGAVGFFVGIVSLRLTEHYFAIFTLCVGFIIWQLLEKWESLTHGVHGVIDIPAPASIGSINFAEPVPQYYLVLLVLVLALWLMHRLVTSLLGRTFLAIRNSEELAEALGIRLMRNKVLAFVLSTIMAGYAGGLYAGSVRFLDPNLSSVTQTFEMITYLLVGGIGTLFGPLIGAMSVIWISQYLQFLQDYRMIVFGPLLVVLVIFFPRGIVGYLQQRRMESEAKKVEMARRPATTTAEVNTNA
ncbi:MAG TPA: branched-chain amino acid ABC transporter permease [Gammaproteobacteria bacterium]|nr:branched-chain amino acid ABC transporter permease [Gammaproteobacteria bacterium]